MGIKRGEAVGTILKVLLISGALMVASTSPYFGVRLARSFMRNAARRKKINDTEKERFRSAFYYLDKKGLIVSEYRGGQLYISLTKEGRKRAGKYKIDDLKIKKPKVWDKKWRILIFDIEDKQKIKREALRGKLKELSLYQLQKSVWVYPYDFKKEMILLRDFFGLTNNEMKVITASEIENDRSIKECFKLT